MRCRNLVSEDDEAAFRLSSPVPDHIDQGLRALSIAAVNDTPEGIEDRLFDSFNDLFGKVTEFKSERIIDQFQSNVHIPPLMLPIFRPGKDWLGNYRGLFKLTG